MNAETKSLNHFERTDFDAGQSKAAVVGIENLLVKSMAVFNHHFEAMDRRFNALENFMRFQMIGLICIAVAILIGFASLFYAISK